MNTQTEQTLENNLIKQLESLHNMRKLKLKMKKI
jgi:hypothetical protein